MVIIQRQNGHQRMQGHLQHQQHDATSKSRSRNRNKTGFNNLQVQQQSSHNQYSAGHRQFPLPHKLQLQSQRIQQYNNNNNNNVAQQAQQFVNPKYQQQQYNVSTQNNQSGQNLILNYNKMHQTRHNQQNFPSSTTMTKFDSNNLGNCTEINNDQYFSEKIIQPLKSPQISQQIAGNSQSIASQSQDDEGGHYQYKIGENIYNKFIITRHLADGTFGRVFEVRNILNGRIYALKMIRAVERYVSSAKVEAKILEHVQQNASGKSYISRFFESFNYGNNYCMIFERLGPSLYDFLKQNNYKGFKINFIQSFFKQCLMAIGMLHKLGLTHTDLKPENILLRTDEYEQIENDSTSYSNNQHSVETQSTMTSLKQQSEHVYKIPKSDDIKIIDFGGATFDHEYHSPVINTRQYRSPEVIFESGWTTVSDVWSLGCIILELYSGDLYFETHDVYEHLAMIEKTCGKLPIEMVKKASPSLEKYFTLGHQLAWPKNAVSPESVKKVKNMRVISEIINYKHRPLADLIQLTLEMNPNKRITCENALQHEFFSIDYSQ